MSTDRLPPRVQGITSCRRNATEAAEAATAEAVTADAYSGTTSICRIHQPVLPTPIRVRPGGKQPPTQRRAVAAMSTAVNVS